MGAISIGFIGLGGMGRQHTRNFSALPGCRVVAGADVAAGVRDSFATDFPAVKLYPDPRQVLDHPGIDAVVVCTPTGHHRDHCIAALEAGKHVLVEKPMARTVAQCREMNAAAAKAGRLLMVAQCRRFDPNWGAFAQVYRNGALGKQVLWRNIKTGVGPGRWYMDDRLGGGPLFDGAVHDYDFANYVFGDPESVLASALKLDPASSAIDTASMVAHYRNGSQIMLSWSWATNGQYLHDCLGTPASLIFGLNGLPDPGEGFSGHCLLDPKGNKTLVKFAKQDMYVNESRHFLDCIAGNAKCLSPGTEAIKAVAVGEAVLAAARDTGVAKVTW